LFYSNRTVINSLIKFRLIFIQTKRVSYNGIATNPCHPVRARSIKKKRNLYIFFLHAPSSKDFFHPQSSSGIVCDGRVSTFSLSHLPLSLAHIRSCTHTHTHRYHTRLASPRLTSPHSFLSFHLYNRFFVSRGSLEIRVCFLVLPIASLVKLALSCSQAFTLAYTLARMRTFVASYK
jgi:hypothetical protein